MKNEKSYSYHWEDETLTVFPTMDMYRSNNNLYLGLDYWDEELEIRDSWCDLTVNIGKLPYLHSAIDIDLSGEDKIRFLVENGIAEDTGKSLLSGFCTFPIFRFHEDKLRELNPEVFDAYAKAHGREVPEKPSLDSQIKQADTKDPSKGLPSKEKDTPEL